MAGAVPYPTHLENEPMSEQVEVAIIGAGQAGLSAGYYLMQQKRNVVILEQASQVGQAWRDRWDSLKLITPIPYNNLPGLPFPAGSNPFPTRQDMIAYLEQYAQTFSLPIRYNQSVKALKSTAQGYAIETNTTTLEAKQVIVATGAYQKPFIPAFAASLPAKVLQIHSSQYRNPEQLLTGDVLVVGGRNSGAQIARELSASHKVYLSVGTTPGLPRTILGRDLFWWLNTLKVTRIEVSSRLGQRLSQRPDMLVGINLQTLAKENDIVFLGRAEDVKANQLRFASGEMIAFNTIIWATGFRPNYTWIQVPIFDSQGSPIHQRGITNAPGLYFLGLRWQNRLTSSLIGGVGEDAAFIASDIAKQYVSSQSTYSPYPSTEEAYS